MPRNYHEIASSDYISRKGYERGTKGGLVREREKRIKKGVTTGTPELSEAGLLYSSRVFMYFALCGNWVFILHIQNPEEMGNKRGPPGSLILDAI